MRKRNSIFCVSIAIVSGLLMWSGAVTSLAGLIQTPCDSNVEICSKATPKPGVKTSQTPRKAKTTITRPHTPTLAARSLKKIGALAFDQLATGKVAPNDKNSTGVIKETDKKFTLFNAYNLKATKSDRFVIQIKADSSSPVQVSILDNNKVAVPLKPLNVSTGEIELQTANGQLPADGEYLVQVQFSGLSAKSQPISYRIIVARITPIATGKAEEGRISGENSRWSLPFAAGKQAFFNEHVLTVEDSDPLVLQLNTAQLQHFKVSVSEWGSRQEIKGGQSNQRAGEFRFNAPGATQLSTGKYRLQVQYATPQGGAATPYTLTLTKFAPLKIGANVDGQFPKFNLDGMWSVRQGAPAYWHDYPLAVSPSELLTINLQPGGLALQVLDDKGKAVPLTPSDPATGEIDLATADGMLGAAGKYYVRVQLNSPSIVPVAYKLKLNLARLSAEEYQAAVKKIQEDFERTKDFDTAVKKLRRLIRSNREWSQAYGVLGMVYLGQQNFAQARENFEQSLRYGGAVSFEIYHNEKWSKIESTDRGELEWKKQKQSSLKLQQNKLLMQGKSDEVVFTSQTIKGVLLMPATAKVLIEFSDTDPKNRYFMPVSMRQGEAELIVSLIDKHVRAGGR